MVNEGEHSERARELAQAIEERLPPGSLGVTYWSGESTPSEGAVTTRSDYERNLGRAQFSVHLVTQAWPTNEHLCRELASSIRFAVRRGRAFPEIVSLDGSGPPDGFLAPDYTQMIWQPGEGPGRVADDLVQRYEKWRCWSLLPDPDTFLVHAARQLSLAQPAEHDPTGLAALVARLPMSMRSRIDTLDEDYVCDDTGESGTPVDCLRALVNKWRRAYVRAEPRRMSEIESALGAACSLADPGASGWITPSYRPNPFVFDGAGDSRFIDHLQERLDLAFRHCRSQDRVVVDVILLCPDLEGVLMTVASHGWAHRRSPEKAVVRVVSARGASGNGVKRLEESLVRAGVTVGVRACSDGRVPVHGMCIGWAPACAQGIAIENVDYEDVFLGHADPETWQPLADLVYFDRIRAPSSGSVRRDDFWCHHDVSNVVSSFQLFSTWFNRLWAQAEVPGEGRR